MYTSTLNTLMYTLTCKALCFQGRTITNFFYFSSLATILIVKNGHNVNKLRVRISHTLAWVSVRRNVTKKHIRRAGYSQSPIRRREIGCPSKPPHFSANGSDSKNVIVSASQDVR